MILQQLCRGYMGDSIDDDEDIYGTTYANAISTSTANCDNDDLFQKYNIFMQRYNYSSITSNIWILSENWMKSPKTFAFCLNKSES